MTVQKAANQKLYPEYKQANFPEFEKEVAQFWKDKNIFQKSIDNRNGAHDFVFL